MYTELLLYALIFIAGASWGSFVLVVAMRQGKLAWARGRSQCVNCKKNLQARDLIPLLSFLLLRGKCRYCKQNMSAYYVLVEACMGALFLYGAYAYAGVLWAITYFLVITFFSVLVITDARTYTIPDSVSIPAIIAVGICGAFLHGALPTLIGGIAGALWFFAQFALSKGRWVGGGDIRVGALMGVLVGYPLIWLSLGLSYIGGSVIALVLIALRKKTMASHVPFGVFLLPAAFATWLWGDWVWGWYVYKILGF